MLYYNEAQKAVTSSDLTWAKVREATNDEWYALSQMKFEDPADGTQAFQDSAFSEIGFSTIAWLLIWRTEYQKLYDRIVERFRNLTD
jgi:V-type H+-transporting ATPase subunit A